MTCVVGYLDLLSDCVWIGADSLGSNGFLQAVESRPKVFRNEIFKNIIMGSTTTFRHIDLLKYAPLFDELDLYKNTEIDHKYMVTKFIPRLTALFQEGIRSASDKDKGANFIIGVKDRLFEIQDDYSVLEPYDGYTAVGCGAYTAYGSLYTTKDMDIPIPKKIEMALESAEHNICGVQRPFRIINTKDEKEIIIS